MSNLPIGLLSGPRPKSDVRVAIVLVSRAGTEYPANERADLDVVALTTIKEDFGLL